MVAVVTVLAVREIRKSPLFTTLAHSRLVKPATVIGAAYGPDESKAKPTQAIQELFGEETAADRLSVAVSHHVDGLPFVRKATMGGGSRESLEK
jgi:hypothetical protein